MRSGNEEYGIYHESTIKGDMVRHMVIFCLKCDKETTEARNFLSKSEAILNSVPGVKNFQVFKQISQNNEYDFGFSMEFENKAAYDAYSGHPDHVDYVNEIWLKEVDKFLEIDFAVD